MHRRKLHRRQGRVRILRRQPHHTRFLLIFLLAPVLFLAGYVSVVVADAPTLVGLDPNKPLILPMKVQAAYNDDTMFFDIEWAGNRGDTHDLVRFTGGTWQVKGGPRRDA